MKFAGISRQTLIGALAGAGIAVGVIAAPVYLGTAEARPVEVSARTDHPVSFADLIEQVSPAVVSVNVVTEQEIGSSADMERFMERFPGMPGLEEFFEEQRRREGDREDGPRTRQSNSLGSGFFISEDGYIVTNNHVVDGATEIEVVLEDGREYDARLVGADPATDLAVLKVSASQPFRYVEFGSTDDVRRGDWVVALGNPFGYGGTATAGIVSTNGRQLRGSGPYTDFLQIDAAINRGNSGGPTFDTEGKVIGVNSNIISPTGASVGLGFAIPAELAEEVTDSLIKDGRVVRGYLGVQIQDFTEDQAAALGYDETGGAIVSSVVEDGPAEESGIERGDIILGVNGREGDDSTEITRLVGSLRANSTAEFDILRDGRRQTIDVRVGERPSDLTSSVVTRTPDNSEGTEEGSTNQVLGADVRELTSSDRARLSLQPRDKGAVFTNVPSGTAFGELGLQPGHAIIEVNNNPIDGPEALQRAIDTARQRGRDKVLLTVATANQTSFVALDLPEAD